MSSSMTSSSTPSQKGIQKKYLHREKAMAMAKEQVMANCRIKVIHLTPELEVKLATEAYEQQVENRKNRSKHMYRSKRLYN